MNARRAYARAQEKGDAIKLKETQNRLSEAEGALSHFLEIDRMDRRRQETFELLRAAKNEQRLHDLMEAQRLRDFLSSADMRKVLLKDILF